VADDPSEQPMGNGGYDTVTVEATASKTWLADSEPVCEAKETQDCITVELLGVVTNADGTKTYQWKVTSDCNRALSYIAFALPPGVVAVSPVDGAVVRGSATNYKVENTTNNPFYSIKFESQGEGIRDGQSEVFSYTLPAGVSIPDTITVEAKYSTTRTQLILNTENCDDNSTPPPPPVDPDCQVCDGKVTQMTLRYEGSQAATIRVEQKKEGVIFEQIVQPAETFTVYGTDKQATLGTEISIYLDGILNTKIHTSCSQPIGPGLTFGSFTIVEAYSRNGGLMCPVPSRNTAGQPAGTLFQLFIPSVNLDQ
jgi:hypothetical protein